MALSIRFDIGLSQSAFRWLLCSLLLSLCAPDLGSETVTLTSYYPAPTGLYSQIITTDSTWLARDGGVYWVMVGAGNAGANTRMAVMGNMAIGSAASVVNAGGSVVNRLNVSGGPIGGDFALTPKYTNFATQGVGDGGASIYNDNVLHRNLFLRGNFSGGGTISDGAQANRVEIGNELTVTGDHIVTLNSTTGGNSTTNGNSTTLGSSLTSGLVVSRSCPGYPMYTYGAGIFNCPGGTYITTRSGFMAKYTVVTGGDTDTKGNVLCCPCPAGGCPSL